MSHTTAYSGKQDPINCPANQPKPATGECANIHIEHYFPKGYDPDAEPWKSIRKHHNAALAKSFQMGVDSKRTGVATGQSDRQPATGEWTVFQAGLWGIERGEEVIVEAILSKEVALHLIRTHNAALAAEREKQPRKLPAHTPLECEWLNCPSHGLQQLRTQLAAAQAAMKDLRQRLIPSLTSSSDHKILSDIDEYIKGDTAALDAAITEAIEHELFDKLPCGHLKQFLTRGNVFPQTCMACNVAEARQPLVDALTEIRDSQISPESIQHLAAVALEKGGK